MQNLSQTCFSFSKRLLWRDAGTRKKKKHANNASVNRKSFFSVTPDVAVCLLLLLCRLKRSCRWARRPTLKNISPRRRFRTGGTLTFSGIRWATNAVSSSSSASSVQAVCYVNGRAATSNPGFEQRERFRFLNQTDLSVWQVTQEWQRGR